MAKNPEGDLQGVGGGVKSLRGTNNSGVDELPWGGETSGVTLEGEGVLGTDGRGRGGDGNSSAALDTKGSTTTSRGEEMASGQEPAAPPTALRGTADRWR